MNTLIAIIKERIEEVEAAQVHAVNYDEFAQGRLYELQVLLSILAARDPKKEA
jgi:hypothetical protein